jgi:UDP-N-acetylglucosamine--N-acetylmuramyl-(pentapeptide) pyrophosphoryl-undecaprenol N-acetylglucosamine transferase
MTILFAGGGSIGHIAPSLAVYRELLKLDPEIRAHFVCADREDESAFLKREQVNFTTMPRVRLSLAFPLQVLRARKVAKHILDTIKPQALFCKGGGETVPLAQEAFARGIPIILHESDSVSGRANRLISKYANVICTGFPLPSDMRELKKQWNVSSDRLIFTGNPVRPEVRHGSAQKGLRIANLSGKRPILLVMGGSQGAQALNDAVRLRLDDLLEHCDIIHLTGRGKEGKKKELPGYYERAFAHDDLPHFYAVTDLALSRAGAGSLSELAACGIPAIIVPLRGAAHDHQQHNALVAERTGGCTVVQQSDIPKKLLSTIRTLLSNTRDREEMSHRIGRLFIEDAASHIAGIVLDVAQKFQQAPPKELPTRTRATSRVRARRK